MHTHLELIISFLHLVVTYSNSNNHNDEGDN